MHLFKPSVLLLGLASSAVASIYENALGELTEPWRLHWGGPAVRERSVAKEARGFINSGTLGKRQNVRSLSYILAPYTDRFGRLVLMGIRLPVARRMTIVAALLVPQLVRISCFRMSSKTDGPFRLIGCDPGSGLCCGADQFCQASVTCCNTGQVGCGEGEIHLLSTLL
jgi:hypothetical protein